MNRVSVGMTQAFNFDPESMERRVFVVGCSRSGTTLLQSLLAAHPDVATFPETRFFWQILAHAPRRRHLIRLGLATGREMQYLKEMLERFGQDELMTFLPNQPWTFRRSVEIYLATLDHLAKRQNGRLWVEKTPFHIRYVNTIERFVPSPLFVHIVRDGREVVASIVDRARKHPGFFGGQDEKYGVRLWNDCIEKTRINMKKENHHVVNYERIVDETDKKMKSIGNFVGLKYKPEMKKRRVKKHDKFIEPSENHKEKVSGPIRKTESKFESLFDNEKKCKIEDCLNLDVFRSIVSS